MNERDRPIVETLAESLRTAFGDAVTADVSAGLLHLTIGRKEALINSDGILEGESNHYCLVDRVLR
jgi:hypothetical protein